jgi:hypothetical protein
LHLAVAQYSRVAVAALEADLRMSADNLAVLRASNARLEAHALDSTRQLQAQKRLASELQVRVCASVGSIVPPAVRSALRVVCCMLHVVCCVLRVVCCVLHVVRSALRAASRGMRAASSAGIVRVPPRRTVHRL